MSLIDPRAIIDPSAKLADDVQVGPWSIIGLMWKSARVPWSVPM